MDPEGDKLLNEVKTIFLFIMCMLQLSAYVLHWEVKSSYKFVNFECIPCEANDC